MSTEPNELEESLKSPIGQIEPILRCKQHPDRILSGRHRDKILNQQGKTARAQLYDCEALAVKESISHGLAHWLVTSAANVRRAIPEDERQADVMQMAVVLEADGVPPEKRASTIARLTGLTDRRVRQLLPAEHKRDYAQTETISESPTEEKQRFSETASVHRVSTYTQAEQLFSVNLSYWKIEYRTQEPFIRAGEFSNGGQQKTFTADFFLPHIKTVIELEGPGSSSSDNQHRDDFFKERGIHVIHLPNDLATKYGAQIAELIAVLSK